MRFSDYFTSGTRCNAVWCLGSITKLGVRISLQIDAVLAFAKIYIYIYISRVEIMGLYRSDTMSKLSEMWSSCCALQHGTALQ